MVQKANSGHPGLPMGAAPMAYVLWSRFLRFNPQDPHWQNRDRFILSAGHGSALLYSLLHLYGYDLPLAELQNFRQLGSKTPGHPESFLTPGIEVTTGPLGQGFGNGVGVAIAEAFLAAKYNRPDFPLIDHYTYALVSDGDLMEGLTAEAASLAGHLKLGKLIFLYDHSNIWFGVREHGMGSILNGMASHRGVRAYGGTFLTFSDYMRGAIRLAALTEAPVTYVFTHDSIAVGEDGPTHQPVEHITATVFKLYRLFNSRMSCIMSGRGPV